MKNMKKVYETNIALMTGGLALIGVGVVTTAIISQ